MTRLKYLDPSDGQYKLLPVGGGGDNEVRVQTDQPADSTWELWVDEDEQAQAPITQGQADARYIPQVGFATAAARDAAIPAPAEGQICFTAGYMQIRRGTVWASYNGTVRRSVSANKSVNTRYWSKFPMDGPLAFEGLAAEMYTTSADGYGIKLLAGGLYLLSGSITPDTVAASQIFGLAFAPTQPGSSNGMYPFPTAMGNLATLPSRPTYATYAAGTEVWPWVYLNVIPTNVSMYMQIHYLGGG